MDKNMDPLDAATALASGLDSFYEDGRIYKTKTGVHPDEDWGEPVRMRADWRRYDPRLPERVVRSGFVGSSYGNGRRNGHWRLETVLGAL